MQARYVKVARKVALVVAYESGHISLWNWNEKNIMSEVDVNESPICLTYDDESRMGIIGTTSEKVYIFNISSNLIISVVKHLFITNGGVSSCVVRLDGKIFVTGGWDSRVRIFSAKRYKPLAVLQYHKKTVECLAYSTSDVEHFGCGLLLAAGSSDNSISLWNIFNS
ncbi:Guanine nucleotide-binding protein subunit beta-like protein 1-like [Homarus americanus]|uniref:Guanine nucleotide-binding protein subunit beta-like protein 1-like n=2 Tax=Homarus americanus TaxID=6706 RepID=A0A8J5KIU6_HOMAM|nr:Guanine nucleotide-binding protein subunit beta-like protein 1-like [Homarus americanus]